MGHLCPGYLEMLRAPQLHLCITERQLHEMSEDIYIYTVHLCIKHTLHIVGFRSNLSALYKTHCLRWKYLDMTSHVWVCTEVTSPHSPQIQRPSLLELGSQTSVAEKAFGYGSVPAVWLYLWLYLWFYFWFYLWF